MNSGELKRAKREVRRRVLARRDALAATERSALAARITARFLSLPEVERSDRVLAFWSFGSELPTSALIDALLDRGTGVALPRIAEGELEAVAYRRGDRLAEAPFGAFEPLGGHVVDPAAIDAIAVPGVAFDRAGTRVGYGGGFYDRFLAHTRDDASRIAVGFALQLMPPGEALPAGHHDLTVDLIVTESETVRCRPPT
jgi:5-formyltetrahydrofolate cyclo-ligase